MKNKVCVLLGRIYKNINRQLLEGIASQLRKNGASAVVFTLNEDSGNDRILSGELNLFQLIDFSQFDGVIYAPYTFSTDKYYAYLDRFLAERCSLPVVRIGIEKDRFAPVWYDDRSEMAELTRHLIDVHHCRSIDCLTGPEHLDVSHSRLAGYRDAMEATGLVVRPENILFGDFWTNAPQRLALAIAEGTHPMPEAVICANDVMAITLCDCLKEHGISVPEDIRITGYDGYTEAQIHMPPITTYQTSQERLGIIAVSRLWELLTGTPQTVSPEPMGTLICRESCGCTSKRERVQEFNFMQFEGDFLDNTLSAVLHDVETLHELTETLFRHTYTFMDKSRWGRDRFSLCLCEDWNGQGAENGAYQFRTEGYSDTLSVIGERSRMSLRREQLFTEAMWDAGKENLLIVSPASFMDRCFGCCCLAVSGEAGSYNSNYVRFCRELCSGLAFLSIQDKMKSLAYRRFVSETRDSLTGLFRFSESESIIRSMLDDAERKCEPAYVMVLKAENMAEKREEYGSVAYDRFIVDFAEYAYETSPKGAKIFVVSDDLFVLIGNGSFVDLRGYMDGKYTKEKLSEFSAMKDSYPEIVFNALMLVPEYDALQNAYKLLNSRSKLSHYDEIMYIQRRIYCEPENLWTPEKCSIELNLSKTYFLTIYQQIMEHSCVDDIRESRLFYAKFLLKNTGTTLETIAEDCGYEYSYFMRSFKKRFGMTPKQFRNGG